MSNRSLGYKLTAITVSILSLDSNVNGCFLTRLLLHGQNHHGQSLRSGHYTSDLLYEDQWYHADDSRVTKTGHLEADKVGAYLFFFERGIYRSGVMTHSLYRLCCQDCLNRTLRWLLNLVRVVFDKKSLSDRQRPVPRLPRQQAIQEVWRGDESYPPQYSRQELQRDLLSITQASSESMDDSKFSDKGVLAFRLPILFFFCTRR